MLLCEATDTDTVRISVNDTGKGIPEADLPHLFEPFNRLYLATQSLEGTGIGLTIAKQLVERMQGHIGVASELGKGSTFWIELPLGQASPQADTTTVTPPEEVSEAAEEATLLYIEDSPSHIQLLERIVESMSGVRMLSAHTPPAWAGNGAVCIDRTS